MAAVTDTMYGSAPCLDSPVHHRVVASNATAHRAPMGTAVLDQAIFTKAFTWARAGNEEPSAREGSVR